jgi:hypothetical protein
MPGFISFEGGNSHAATTTTTTTSETEMDCCDDDEEYNPENMCPLPTTSEALGNLLLTLTRSGALEAGVGCLLGLPPYNDMYDISFLNTPGGDGFMMTNRSCKLHVFGGQTVRVHLGSGSSTEMLMRDFQVKVLEPSIFSVGMGDTGTRIYFNSGSNPQMGMVTFLTGCNRQNVVCNSYVLGYRVVQ